MALARVPHSSATAASALSYIRILNEENKLFGGFPKDLPGQRSSNKTLIHVRLLQMLMIGADPGTSTNTDINYSHSPTLICKPLLSRVVY